MLKMLTQMRLVFCASFLAALLVAILPGCGSGNTAEQEKTPEQQLEEDKGRQQRELQEVRGG